MEEIKVLFSGRELRQRRRETIQNPPFGVRYSTIVPLVSMRPDHAISKKTGRDLQWAKKTANFLFNFLKIPNIQFIPFKYLRGVDVIHTPGHMLLNHVPYVVEIDNPACLSRYDLEIFMKRKNLIEKFLASGYCKGIICISQAAKKSMAAYFSKKVLQKCEVVYPYVKINPYKKTKNLGKTVILTVNTKFYMKGTRDLLLAYEEVRKKYQNTELWVVSNTPKEYLEKYKDFTDIKFFPAKFSKEELYRDFYSQCDVFVQPSYQDSFGLVYLEIMASGKPIISTDLYAIPELVVDGYNGYLVKAPVYMYNKDYTLKPEYFPMKYADTEIEFYKHIDGREVASQLVGKLDILLGNPGKAAEMGENSLKLLSQKFSENERQNKLLNLYKKVYEND